MIFTLQIVGYGVLVRILTHDFDTQSFTVFGAVLIAHNQEWRRERLFWLNNYKYATLEWERCKNGMRVDGWRMHGPFERTV